MTSRIIESYLIGLIVIFFPSYLKAQLFVENELYPNVRVVKGKYYNGTGGGGYWSLDYVDSIGRVTKKESYRKRQLISRNEIINDNHNNKIIDIQTYDYSNSERIDTNRFEYKYADNLISFQYSKFSDHDSTIVELIENQGDSVLKYQEKAFYLRTKTGRNDVYETIYILRFRNGYLMSKEILNKENNSNEIRNYEYYDNGRLRNRIIERIPKPEREADYVGGPGSDDEYYKYKLDSEGRILKFYKIVNGKRYKIAIYKYY